MKSPIRIALIAALPLEAACLFEAGRTIKGLPADASFAERFFYDVMAIVHWPARILEPFFKIAGDSRPMFLILIALIFVIGYLDWAVVVAAILYGVRFLAGSGAPPQA